MNKVAKVSKQQYQSSAPISTDYYYSLISKYIPFIFKFLPIYPNFNGKHRFLEIREKKRNESSGRNRKTSGIGSGNFLLHIPRWIGAEALIDIFNESPFGRVQEEVRELSSFHVLDKSMQ